MIPETVSFYQMEINPSDIIKPRHVLLNGIPASWERIYSIIPMSHNIELSKMNAWMEEHIYGRWFINLTYVDASFMLVAYFEDANDAMLFRLMDGEKRIFEETAKE